MEFVGAIHDPLTINLKRQTRSLLSKIPSGSPHAATLLNASTQKDLLSTLSYLLAVPSLTLAVATAFRPLLIPLCAHWLDYEEDTEEKLVALCLLLQPHEELFPYVQLAYMQLKSCQFLFLLLSILSQFLRKPEFQNGPLAFLLASQNLKDIDVPRLHRLLLAYYRILLASRQLPHNLLWPLSPLSKLFWTPHLDTGVQLLAIRCYAMQSGMGEAEREKLETEILGEACGIDCQIGYGENIDGSSSDMDGWIMSAFEAKRIIDARNSIFSDPHDYFTFEEGEDCEPIRLTDLRQVYSHFLFHILSFDLLLVHI